MTPETAAQLATDWARSGGYTLTPEGLAIVAERIASTLERDASGFAYRDEAFNETFRIENGTTVPVPVGEFVAGLMQRHGKPTPRPPTAQDAPSPTIRPAKIEVNTPIAAFGRQLAAKHDAAVLREASEWPNPFLAGPNFNRTRQQVLTNKNPALAAQYKAQTGK